MVTFEQMLWFAGIVAAVVMGLSWPMAYRCGVLNERDKWRAKK